MLTPDDWIQAKQVNRNRKRKELSFEGKPGIYRIQLVDSDGNAHVLNQKNIPTDVQWDSYLPPRFRVKAVLKEPIHSTIDSHWLSMKHWDDKKVLPLNQFRIRGVDSSNRKGDWVYSNLIDDQNQVIFFQALYDFVDGLIDLMDDDIEAYVLKWYEEFLTYHYRESDAVPWILWDSTDQLVAEVMEQFKSSLGIKVSTQEIVAATAEEQMQVHPDYHLVPQEHLKQQFVEYYKVLGLNLYQAFKEVMLGSFDEFMDWVKTKHVFDQMKYNQTDFFTLLIESFVEDYYEKMVKNEKLEILAEKEGNFELYLGSEWDFKVKQDLVESAYAIALNDDFVEILNSTVKLFIDYTSVEEKHVQLDEDFLAQAVQMSQWIQEWIQTSSLEDIRVFMKFIIEDGWLPLHRGIKDLTIPKLSIDRHDQADVKPAGQVVSYDLYDEEVEKITLLYDWLQHLLLHDTLKYDFEYVLIDKILTLWKEKSVRALLYRDVRETLQLFHDTAEHMHVKYYGVVRYPFEDQVSIWLDAQADIRWNEPCVIQDSLVNSSSEQIKMQPTQERKVQEAILLALMDLGIIETIREPLFHEEFLQVTQRDHLTIKGNYDCVLAEGIDFLLSDSITLHKSRWRNMFQEDWIIQNAEYLLRYLLPHKQDKTFRLYVDEKYDSLVQNDLTDLVELDIVENVKYALGNIDGIRTLGLFILGATKLQGGSET